MHSSKDQKHMDLERDFALWETKTGRAAPKI